MRRGSASRTEGGVLIEGYASLFGVEDQTGDIVRAGAFTSSVGTRAIPMLLQHRAGAIVGRWHRIVEDGRGLFVRGLIESRSTQLMVRNGLDGLSIGFRPRVWTHHTRGGRVLVNVDLIEVSLVNRPALPAARFQVVSGFSQQEKKWQRK